jgi:hypothetical protein
MWIPMVVIARDGDVWVFKGSDRAAAWMEAQDVRDGEYRLFDCTGLEYALRADSDDSPVVVGPPMSEERHGDLVLDASERFLGAMPHSMPQGRSHPADDLCERLRPHAL